MPTKILCSQSYPSGMKTFPDKQKLRKFIISRLALQEMLKGVLKAEMKRQKSVTWKYESIQHTGINEKNMQSDLENMNSIIG